VELDLGRMGLDAERPFQVHDLLTNAHYLWKGPRNYIEVNPHSAPAHIFRIRRRIHTERDFDYYL
jgi:starch synthase (maltosyl-transferring)